MRSRQLPLPLAAVAVLAACARGGTSHGPSAATTASCRGGDTVRVVLGQPVVVDGDRLSVRLVDVADSRCPTGKSCVWQGDAAARLRLDAGGSVATPTLHTMLDPKAVTHAGYEVALLDVTPHPGTAPDRVRVAPTATLRLACR